MAEIRAYRIEVDLGGGVTKTFAMTGPATAEAARAEFQRQQKLTTKDGAPLMPAGEVTKCERARPEDVLHTKPPELAALTAASN